MYFACVKKWQCDSLLGITFVGVYGDVVRVKILFNKKDTALIQFNYVQQAQTGNFVLKLLKHLALNDWP